MNDKERENLARIRRGVYIYDCYDKPVTTIAGAFNDNPDRSIVMVVDPTHPQTDTPFREILVLDPQMAVRLALRLMNEADRLIGHDAVVAARAEAQALFEATHGETS